MSKCKLSLLVLFAFITSANAQLKLDGPKDAKIGEVVRIKATEFKGDDPKVVCVPPTDRWEATKNLNGEIVILLFPNEAGTYSVFLATNLDKKTLTATHTTKFTGGTPKPPAPVIPPDVPVPNELTNKLTAAYLVSPDEEALKKLVQIYEQVVDENTKTPFKTFKEAETVLANTAKAVLQDDTKLRKVRDEVALYLQKTVGQTGTFVPAKLNTSLKTVVLILKGFYGSQSQRPKSIEGRTQATSVHNTAYK